MPEIIIYQLEIIKIENEYGTFVILFSSCQLFLSFFLERDFVQKSGQKIRAALDLQLLNHVLLIMYTVFLPVKAIMNSCNHFKASMISTAGTVDMSGLFSDLVHASEYCVSLIFIRDCIRTFL